MRRLRKAIGSVGVLLLIVGPLYAAMPEDGVGIVAEYRPASARFELVRGAAQQKVQVRIGTAVASGDRVTLPAEGSIVVRMGDEAPHEFTGPGTYQIPSARPLGAKARFLERLGILADSDAHLDAIAASRGGDDCQRRADAGPIRVPLLAARASLVAGVRDLPLAWHGGCQPFTVELRDASQRLLRRESVARRQVRLDAVPFVPGRYSITIAGATNQRFSAPLEVVAAGPELPADIAGDSSPLGVIGQAAWLAERDEGRWRFEAFERLRPQIRGGDRLAGTLGDAILWGQADRP
jgi:hypothetical protein